MSLGRNDPCACGSGRKAKKCHPALVGQDLAELRAVVELRRQTAADLDTIAQFEGYQPPPDGADGWSRANYRASGCPYESVAGGACCNRDTDVGEPCAAGCGV